MSRKVIHLQAPSGSFTACGRPTSNLHYSGALSDVTCRNCKYSAQARQMREGS